MTACLTAVLVLAPSVGAGGEGAPTKAGKAAPRSSANLWLDTNGGRCVRRSGPGRYVDGDACGSLKEAYVEARAGDTINVRDGVYGSQVMSALDKPVTVRAAGPGRPSFGVSNFAGAGVTVKGLKFEFRDGTTDDDDWVCLGPPPAGRGLSGKIYMNGIINPCANRITFDDVEIDGLQNAGTPGSCPLEGIKVGAVDRFTFRNGSVHGIYDRKGADIDATRVTIENTVFYDIRIRNVCYPDVHNECIYVPRAERSVFRNNRFINCPTMALYFSGEPDTDSDYVTVEGNLFTHTTDAGGNWHAGSCALKIGAGPSRINGWVVRYNTFETSPCLDDLPAGAAPGQWYGNLGPASCISGFRYHHNVGETCGGASSLVVRGAGNNRANPNRAPFYVDAPGGDFRLKARSAAIGRGDLRSVPLRDLAGRLRPAGNGPDVGAYEYVPAAPGFVTLELTGSGSGSWAEKGVAERLRYTWRGSLTFKVPARALASPSHARFRARASGVLVGSWRGSVGGSRPCTYEATNVSARVTAVLTDARGGVLELTLRPRGGAKRFFSASSSASCAASRPPHFAPEALFRGALTDRGLRTTTAALIRLPSRVLPKSAVTVSFPRERGTTGPGRWSNRGRLTVRAVAQ